MNTLIVVNQLSDWPLHTPGVQIVTGRDYLTDPAYIEMRGARIYNLCRSYRYQSLGYYVSLLAAARGHKPLPSITTIQDLKQQAILRVAADDLDRVIQTSLAHLKSRDFVVSIYFGRNVAKHYDRLARQLFGLFPAPFLSARFEHDEERTCWDLVQLAPMAASDIPEAHHGFAVEAAEGYFSGKRRSHRRRSRQAYDLAILYNPTEEMPPSNARALRHFIEAAEKIGFDAELITREDYGHIGEYDALFLRETTAVNHHTYRFARRAAAEGLAVIDDPESILKCTNKVFLAELLNRKGILTPKTAIVHKGNIGTIGEQLGFPCILKQPDSSFSQGVIKVDAAAEFETAVTKMLTNSALVIAQEFMPTPFDWRIGVVGGQALFACKYYMAKSHWQIYHRDGQGRRSVGNAETLAMDDVPRGVINIALKAANLIGTSLYGVDIKQVGNRFYVIEVNDNPNVDAGVEDEVLKSTVYERILGVLLERVVRRAQRTNTNGQQ